LKVVQKQDKKEAPDVTEIVLLFGWTRRWQQ